MSKDKIERTEDVDREVALDSAMRIFWEKGYEGATLADLADAMGLTRSGMHSAFGNKESLFVSVIERFKETPVSFMSEALELPNVEAVIKALLHKTVDFLGGSGNLKGCISIQGALAAGSESEQVKKSIVEWRKQGETALMKRFLDAQNKGDFPETVEPNDFARLIVTIIVGLAVQAANYVTKSEMKRIVDINLRLMRGVIFDTNR